MHTCIKATADEMAQVVNAVHTQPKEHQKVT